MKRSTIVVLLLLTVFFVNAQTKLDSLVNLSNRLMMSDREAYFSLSQEIIGLAKAEKNDSILIEAHMTRAMVYFLSRSYQKAFNDYDTVQNIAPKDSRRFLEARIGATDILPKLNYPDTIIVQKHLSIIEQILPTKDSLLIASEYSNFGNYLVDKAKYYRGIKYLIQSIDFTPQKMGYKQMLNLFKLAKLFLYINDFEKAAFYSAQAMRIAETNSYTFKDKFLAAMEGRIAINQGNYLRADSMLNKALKNFKKPDEHSDVFNTYLYLANLELTRNRIKASQTYLDSAREYRIHAKQQYNQAKFFLLQAENHLLSGNLSLAAADLDSIEQINKDIQNIFIRSDYALLRSRLAKAQNDFEKGLSYYQEYKQWQDSLFKFETTGKIYDLESKYQNQEKLREIELLTTKNELISVKLDHERWLRWGILVFSGVILIFLIFLTYTYFRVKAKNELIRKTAAQKDLLLKEIHHRVKNNLQLISSLLNLQSRYIKDEKARQVSMEGKTRVRAMSLIHQFLYQKDDLMHLSLDEYFRKLVRELLEIYHRSTDEIQVKFDIAQIDLDVDRVIPLGLIFNELMTNVLKYAFPGDKSGKVWVSLIQENEKLILEVKDNGVGIKTEQLSSNNDSFGFTLIEALLSKWKGKLEVIAENGTNIRITIPSLNNNS